MAEEFSKVALQRLQGFTELYGIDMGQVKSITVNRDELRIELVVPIFKTAPGSPASSIVIHKDWADVLLSEPNPEPEAEVEPEPLDPEPAAPKKRA